MNIVFDTIFKRRSTRKFTDQEIPDNLLHEILEAARWAPSGLNNQPWRFTILKNPEIKNKISELTRYSAIVKDSSTCIAIFYHLPSGYNREKDIMSIGACIQNILLASASLGIGAVWLGEILKNKNNVNSYLEINSDNELMAIIALGYPDEKPQKDRKPLQDLIINREKS